MKLSKKFKVLSLVISALMIISAFPIVGSAAAGITNVAVSKSFAEGVWTFDVTYTATEIQQVTAMIVVADTDTSTFPDASLDGANIIAIDQQEAIKGKFTIKVAEQEGFGYLKLGGTSLNEAVKYIDGEGGAGIKLPYIDGPTVLLGDLNGDKNVTVEDTALHFQYVRGIITGFTVPGSVNSLADYNNDTFITVEDTAIHFQRIRGILNKFPNE